MQDNPVLLLSAELAVTSLFFGKSGTIRIPSIFGISRILRILAAMNGPSILRQRQLEKATGDAASS